MIRDEAALRSLKRAELQQLATQEKIKANLKTEVIIQQLLKKYPGGVPRKATPGLSTTRGRAQASSSGRGEASVRSTRNQRTDSRPQQASGSRKRIRDSEPGPALSLQQRPPKRPRVDPSLKEIRTLLREMKSHVNSLPRLEHSVQEIEALLEEARETTNAARKQIEEMAMLRWITEEDVLKKMKKNPALVDGTTALGKDSAQAAAWIKWQEEDRQALRASASTSS